MQVAIDNVCYIENPIYELFIMSHDDIDNVKIGLPIIWAIGVGSVLGGDFFGQVL